MPKVFGLDHMVKMNTRKGHSDKVGTICFLHSRRACFAMTSVDQHARQFSAASRFPVSRNIVHEAPGPNFWQTSV